MEKKFKLGEKVRLTSTFQFARVISIFDQETFYIKVRTDDGTHTQKVKSEEIQKLVWTRICEAVEWFSKVLEEKLKLTPLGFTWITLIQLITITTLLILK